MRTFWRVVCLQLLSLPANMAHCTMTVSLLGSTIILKTSLSVLWFLEERQHNFSILIDGSEIRSGLQMFWNNPIIVGCWYPLSTKKPGIARNSPRISVSLRIPRAILEISRIPKKDKPTIKIRRFSAAKVDGSLEALNASDGQILWNFEPDVAVWNFLALFPDKDAWCFLGSHVLKSMVVAGP